VAPYQWAAAGYAGAIGSGRTVCGALFGGTVFLGYLYGKDNTQAPHVQGESRTRAVFAVRRLYRSFINRFGDTDCQTLTGCDWSKKADRERYHEAEVYKETCYHHLEHVFGQCLGQITTTGQQDTLR
jgi:hypothetical protein